VFRAEWHSLTAVRRHKARLSAQFVSPARRARTRTRAVSRRLNHARRRAVRALRARDRAPAHGVRGLARAVGNFTKREEKKKKKKKKKMADDRVAAAAP